MWISALASRPERQWERRMAKGSKEVRKPKKAGPPKQNASNPSVKGVAASPAKR
jgi:hypothetical protein